jgi:hypothetical protein
MKFAEFCHRRGLLGADGRPRRHRRGRPGQKARRDAYLVPSPDGYLGKMNFDVIGGAIVAKELKRIEEELFEADWAEAKERLGRDPHVDDLARTPAQRRADAMIEMAVRSASTPAGAQRPEPLFSVLIDYPTLWGRISQLEQGPVVAPGSLLSWLDTATFERIVFGPDKRGECSKTSRFFTGATRRVIEVRDLECQHEFCDLSAEKCQIDHIVPFSEGGLTEQSNAQVLCGPTTGCVTSGPRRTGSGSGSSRIRESTRRRVRATDIRSVSSLGSILTACGLEPLGKPRGRQWKRRGRSGLARLSGG